MSSPSLHALGVPDGVAAAAGTPDTTLATQLFLLASMPRTELDAGEQFDYGYKAGPIVDRWGWSLQATNGAKCLAMPLAGTPGTVMMSVRGPPDAATSLTEHVSSATMHKLHAVQAALLAAISPTTQFHIAPLQPFKLRVQTDFMGPQQFLREPKNVLEFMRLASLRHADNSPRVLLFSEFSAVHEYLNAPFVRVCRASSLSADTPFEFVAQLLPDKTVEITIKHAASVAPIFGMMWRQFGTSLRATDTGAQVCFQNFQEAMGVLLALTQSLYKHVPFAFEFEVAFAFVGLRDKPISAAPFAKAAGMTVAAYEAALRGPPPKQLPTGPVVGFNPAMMLRARTPASERLALPADVRYVTSYVLRPNATAAQLVRAPHKR